MRKPLTGMADFYAEEGSAARRLMMQIFYG